MRFGEQYGHLPARPVDKSRVSGVSSFAVLPMFGGEFREEVAKQCGYRTPAASDWAEGTNSGLRSAAPDPDAAVTAPGVAPSIAEKVIGAGRSEAQNDASLLGKVSAECWSLLGVTARRTHRARRSW